MAYVFSTTNLGFQPVAETSTTLKVPLGTIARAVDPTYGSGEFIYLLGVASTVVGSVVSYNASSYLTALDSGGATATGAPLAVAMSANVADQYGWYQIAGLAVVKKTAVKFTPQVAAYLSGTAGRITSVSSAGKQIEGARSANLATVTTTTSTVLLQINRPHRTGV